ncbi:DUF4142 domain-containing protein [Azospirillum doebereinerae]|uniref:DUF4142 domain-containing protein n=1 Tax=Azospirillum doebereinerae TaxID=92933 RepID=UPI001EE59D9A|nr:DUF4142 domain-containing protein [Azospirillum doebereinerae]MCG5243096.1 DUF4142 domain-containing protein [Azospirillum doebereinerae]
MKRQLLLTAATVVLLATPAIGMAQQPNPTAPPAAPTQAAPSQAAPSQAAPGQGQLSAQDRGFVEKAAISDQFEIQAGKLATEKGQKAEVKTLGRSMVTDHGKTAETMKSLAKTKSVALPTALDAEHKQKLDRLSGLSGAAFDSAYVQGQLDAHRTAVALFDTQIKEGQDNDLKQFAQKTLPTLQEHLHHVQTLLPSVASTAPNEGTHGMQTSSVLPDGTLANAAQAPQKVSFNNLIGTDIYGENGNKLGDVSDVILDPQSGAATAVILNRGGVLGIGAKQIALDYALLDTTGERVVARQLTDDQVKAMPEFRYEDTTVSLGERSRKSGTDKSGADAPRTQE